jgi:hypothetical protein
MPVIRRIFRPAARLAALAAGLLAGLVAAPAAFAMAPHPGSGGTPGPAGAAARQAGAGAVTAGTPGWQIALLVAGVAVLAAVIAVRLDRRHASRRRELAVAAR